MHYFRYRWWVFQIVSSSITHLKIRHSWAIVSSGCWRKIKLLLVLSDQSVATEQVAWLCAEVSGRQLRFVTLWKQFSSHYKEKRLLDLYDNYRRQETFFFTFK